MTLITRTEKIYLNKTKQLVDMLYSSAKIYNQSLYKLRQSYFETRNTNKIIIPNFNQLYHIVKESEQYKNACLDTAIKVNCIKQASNMWTYWIKALISYNKNPDNFTGRPGIPKYFKQDKLNVIEIDKSRLGIKGCKENEIRLPKSDFIFKLPNYINKKQIRCLRILEQSDKIKLEIIYEKEIKEYDLNKQNFIGIDIGLNNLASITSNNQNLSMIINGRPLKAINQYYNKKKSKIQSELKKCNKKYWSKKLSRLEFKRKNKIDNYLHWASKQIIDICLVNDIRIYCYW